MDKLKTRLLFISLIMLALVSVSAVAAADVDDVVVDAQDDFDLSEETVSDVQESSDVPQSDKVVSSVESSDKLSADGEENPDGSSTYFFEMEVVKPNGTNIEKTSRKIPSGTSWSINEKFFNEFVKNNLSFDYNKNHYEFDHWINESGDTVDTSQRIYFPGDGYNHTVKFTAVYAITPIGSLTVNYIDNIANGGGGMSYIEYATGYKHTFKEPADIPSGAVFLYWQNENGTTYGPGDELEIKYEEFKGTDKVVNVYAVYNIKTSVELEEITGYFGDVVDITAKITEKVNNTAVPGGTATLTIDFTTKLSNGLLGAGTYTDTVDVVDGQAVFKDIKLDATPGTYSYKVEYSGYPYEKIEEGINEYLTSEDESKVNILPLNTTTTADDVSGTAGDKKDITADIVDQNGDPVQNGTAVLKVNGKEYTAEVVNGKAVFKNVELPDESTEATIEYLGNDYYNPSNTTIQITVTQPEEPEEPEEPVDEPEEEPSTPVAEKAIPVTPAAGNPIALVVLALLTLVSTVSLGRKK